MRLYLVFSQQVWIFLEAEGIVYAPSECQVSQRPCIGESLVFNAYKDKDFKSHPVSVKGTITRIAHIAQYAGEGFDPNYPILVYLENVSLAETEDVWED